MSSNQQEVKKAQALEKQKRKALLKDAEIPYGTLFLIRDAPGDIEFKKDIETIIKDLMKDNNHFNVSKINEVVWETFLERKFKIVEWKEDAEKNDGGEWIQIQDKKHLQKLINDKAARIRATLEKDRRKAQLDEFL
ncbi:MAG: hypothetical protein SGARI_003854, partial [Bacillariaceae sp.]